MDQGPGLELAQTIRALRRELNTAMEQGRDEDVRFVLGPVELELQFQVAGEDGDDAGVRFYVISVGTRTSRSTTETHTIKLSLHPKRRGGEDVDIYGSLDDASPAA